MEPDKPCATSKAEITSAAYFTKEEVLKTIGDSYREQTIIIKPFTADLLVEYPLHSWISESCKFYIRKSARGKSIALLQFNSREKANQALTDLRVKISATSKDPLDVEFVNCEDTLDNICNHLHFDRSLGVPDLNEETVLERQALLEGVPSSMPLDLIAKTFPYATNIMDFRDEQEAPGTVAVEFPTKGELQALHKTRSDFLIDSRKVLFKTFDEATCKKYKNLVQHFRNSSDIFKPLNDDLRIDMCKAYRALEDERAKVFNKTDIFSQEKRAENTRICALMKPYCNHVIADTRRRLNAGDKTLPETLDYMISPVAHMLMAESKHVYRPLYAPTSTKLQELLEKASQKANIKLTLLEKARSLAEERSQIADEIAKLPKYKDKPPQPVSEAAPASTSTSTASTSAPPSQQEGDWVCVQCGTRNPCRRYECRNHRCRAKNTDTTTREPRSHGKSHGSSHSNHSSNHGSSHSHSSNKSSSKGSHSHHRHHSWDRHRGSGEEGPSAKRPRGSAGRSQGPSGRSQDSFDEVQAKLEERLRKLEQMQLETLQIQSNLFTGH